MTSTTFGNHAVPRRVPAAALLVVAGLGAVALWLSPGLQAAAVSAAQGQARTNDPTATFPGIQLTDALKLLLAAGIGGLITTVQAQTRRDLPLTRSMAQTYVLLCIAGALTMTMIGESLPRAFAVGGAASIVKFRTPVEDPRDGVALFLLMGRGMACGVGAYGIAISGALFLAATLVVLSRQGGGTIPRSMRVAVVADGPTLPVAQITEIFSTYQIQAEPFEITHGQQTVVRYRAVLQGHRPIEEVTQHLLDGGVTGIKSVSWETPKRWM